MHQGEGLGGQLPHPILADQKAPPGSGGAPHYYLPPGFLTLGASLMIRIVTFDRVSGIYVPVISKTLEHIETFNTNYKDSS